MDKGDWLAIFIPIGFTICLVIGSYIWKRRQQKRLVQQFLEVTGLLENKKWVEQFLKIKKRTDKIVWGLHNAINAKSLGLELAALRKAANELPALIKKLNELKMPDNERTQQAFSYYVSGLASYLLACQYFKKSFEEEDEESAKEGARQIKIAGELMDKSFELSK